ncbi:MAG: calcium-binding protein [Pseudomonadota bacterium]
MSATIRDILAGFQSANLDALNAADFASIQSLSGLTFGQDGLFASPIDVSAFLTNVELVDNLLFAVNDASSDIDALEAYLLQANPGYFALYTQESDRLQAQVNAVWDATNPSLWDFMTAEFSVLTTALTGIATTFYSAIVSAAAAAGTHLFGAATTIGTILTPAALNDYAKVVGAGTALAVEFEDLLRNGFDFVEVLEDLNTAMQSNNPQDLADAIDATLDNIGGFVSQADRLADLLSPVQKLDPKISAVLKIASALNDFGEALNKAKVLQEAADDPNLTETSRNFIDDVLFYTRVEYLEHAADVLAAIKSVAAFLPGSTVVVSYLTDAVGVLSDVASDYNASRWEIDAARFDTLSGLLSVLAEYQVLLGAALYEADRLNGGLWGTDQDTTGPLADITAEYQNVLAQVAAQDSQDSVTVQNLAAVLGNVSGGIGAQRAVVDYSGYAARPGDDYTLYFTPDAAGSDYIWDGTTTDFFSLSSFEHYTVTGTEGRDFIRTEGGRDVIRAGAGDDYVFAGIGADHVWLGRGDDAFDTQDMDDQVFGGAGFDILYVSWSTFTTGVTLQTGATTGQWQGFESFSGTLTQGDDVVIFDGGFLETISGRAGFDQITVDYSGFAARGGDEITLYFTPDAAGGDYVWDGTALDYFDISTFERYFITATAGHDFIRTEGGNDVIRAGGGNDSVRGGAGRDFVWLDAGDDLFETWDMDDRAFGGVGYDTLIVDWRGFTTGVTLGIDMTTGQWQGFEHYSGTLTLGDDVLVYEGAYLDTISGHSGFDQISVDYSDYAARGGDLFTLYFTPDASGSDYIWDGTALDYFNISSFERYTVTATAGHDYIRTEGGNDVIRAGAGNDNVQGGLGRDFVWLDAGDDLFETSDMDDRAFGGTGYDTLIVSWQGFDTGVTVRNNAGGGQWQGFEKITGTLTQGDDVVVLSRGLIGSLSGYTGEDRITLNYSAYAARGGDGYTLVFTPDQLGSDHIWTGSGTETFNISSFERYILIATAGHDYVRTEGGNDIIRLGDGDDNANAGGGNDVVLGGNGRDSLNLGGGNDRYIDTAEAGIGGRDTVSGEDGNDYINTGGGDDSLNGGSGDDTLLGGDGNDTVEGGKGTDLANLGNGNDTYTDAPQDEMDIVNGGNGNDSISTGGGGDRITGGNGADTIESGTGNDVVRGGNGADDVDLGSGNDRYTDTGEATADGQDTINGGAGNDYIHGGGGDDRIIAGTGNDTLVGGGGFDDFVFADNFGVNIIRDFNANNGNENIVLTDVSAIVDYADLLANHMRQAGANVRIEDGNGNMITLVGENLADLDESDFVF